MLLRCLHNRAGRTEFDLQEGVVTGVCSTSWSQCAFHCQAEEVPGAQQSDMQLCDCWTHTPALFEAVFCSFFFFLIPLLILVSGLLESFLTHWYMRLPLPTPTPTLPRPHPPLLHSVIGQLGLRRAPAVAVGRLGWRVAIRLPLLGCGCTCMRSLRAGRACEQSQGPPAY